jgi:hypothetical protein
MTSEQNKDTMIYEDFKRAVVNRLIEITHESWRKAFESADFSTEYESGETVEDTAQGERDAIIENQ